MPLTVSCFTWWLKMKRNKKFNFKKSHLIIIAVLLVILAGLLIWAGILTRNEKMKVEPTPTVTEAPTEAPTTEPVVTETVPDETEPVMLSNMAELYEKNNEIAGWVRIDGTKIDYAFVYTPEDYDKYLHLDLDGDYSYAGTIMMDQRCTIDPESSNALLHGHNMINGTMFANIMNYKDKAYWEEHPTIFYSTLYEEREYEIFAAIYDKVYNKTDDVFKFYEFTDPQTEEEFNEGVEYFKNKSFYDTGVSPEFGERLLMLSTCSYHVDDGRLVVIAREIVDEAPAEAAE